MNIVIYTTSKCSYCVAAKKWLTERNLDYTEVSLDDMQKREEFKKNNPGLRTVPQIFSDGEYIGGYQELVKSNLA